MLEVEFGNKDLDRLETDRTFSGGFAGAVVRGFRKVMQVIRSASDERDLYALKSLRFEKLKGDRSHQRSLRINDQWRLIVELREVAGKKVVRVVKIEDYH